MRAAFLVGLVALVLAGCASAPRPAVARAMAPESLDLPPPVTVPGLERNCLAIEGAARLDGALATGAGGGAVALAGLAVSDRLPASWTPWLVGSGAVLTVVSQVFLQLHGDDQAKARQCVDDAHARAIADLTASIRGAKP